jgi:hypothetical protein
MLTMQTRITRSLSVLATEISGELVMMDADNGEYYALDHRGTQIWRLMEAPTNIDSLCLEFSGQYDACIEVIRGDILTLVSHMLDKGLVQVVES